MLVGTAQPEAHAGGAPRMDALDADEVTIEDVELVQVLYEIDNEGKTDLLPPALHPTVPGVVGWLAYSCPDSPWGPFHMCQMRIECRSGTRPRGFLLSAVVDNEQAGAALASGWGYRVRIGEIDFRRGYDGVDIGVRLEGEPILALELRQPTLLPADVVQFVSSLHPAHTARGYRLVQVDTVHTLSRAERAQPRIELFDAAAWGDDRVRPRYPISGAIGHANVTLPSLRFMCRPGELAFTGSESVQSPG